jgi:hypothetical protein
MGEHLTNNPTISLTFSDFLSGFECPPKSFFQEKEAFEGDPL